jgi:nitroimidazol reductase NimA-like FMN-containing flavoprotein (pyridoxamine 5'-phosphate oxidase superfamily)
MRRKEKEIADRGEIDAVIKGCDFMHLALARENEPYVVPLNFGYDGRNIYLHTASRGRKIDFFEANPSVCFAFERCIRVIPNDTRPCKWSCTFESVIGNGTITELHDSERKSHGLNQIMLQYSSKEWTFDPAVMEKTRVWCIGIRELAGKRSNI